MKMHLETGEGQNIVRTYAPGSVTINQDVYHQSLIVTPQTVVSDWAPQDFHSLAADDFARLAALEPEIALLGTGTRLRFPKPELLRSLVEAGIGLEVMDTAAACRTYNILMGEGRRVAAALLMIEE